MQPLATSGRLVSSIRCDLEASSSHAIGWCYHELIQYMYTPYFDSEKGRHTRRTGVFIHVGGMSVQHGLKNNMKVCYTLFGRLKK